MHSTNAGLYLSEEQINYHTVLLNFFTYKNARIQCLICGWKGIVSEMMLDVMSEEHLICDFACPKCFEQIGFWQAPLIKEIEAWKKKHPDWKEDK